MDRKIKKALILVIAATVVMAIICVVIWALFLRPQPKPAPIAIDPALPSPTAASDPAVTASMDEIQRQVTLLRGFDHEVDVPRNFLTTAQLETLVREDFFEDYSREDADDDVRSLALFGLLPRGFDLLGLYQDLYSEQIAGFYDSVEKAMYVVSEANFDGLARATYAHEYTHVLQDSAFDFEDGLNYTDEACREDSERCFAIQALIEGDATLTESAWFESYATEQDMQDILDFVNTYASPVLDNAPAYMQADLNFPYLQGHAFAQSLYNEGGFAAIDHAFSGQLPVSSEQILHPSRYPGDTPVPVELPDFASALGDDWEEHERNVMGEWFLYLVIARGFTVNTRLQETIALDAAEGWGGDAYVILKKQDSSEFAAVVKTSWDTPQDATAAADAFVSHAGLRFGSPDDDGVMMADGYFSRLIRVEGGGFTWIITETADTLNAISAILDN